MALLDRKTEIYMEQQVQGSIGQEKLQHTVIQAQGSIDILVSSTQNFSQRGFHW